MTGLEAALRLITLALVYRDRAFTLTFIFLNWNSTCIPTNTVLAHNSRETNMYNFITNMHMQKKKNIKVVTKVA